MEEPSLPQDITPDASPVRIPKNKQKFSITKVFQKMNCFFVDKQAQDFKAYQKGKTYRKHQREIMQALKIPPGPDTSEELDEMAWQSKNTYWLGDDATSLGKYWPANKTEASSSHVPPHNDEMHVEGDDELDEDDEMHVEGDEELEADDEQDGDFIP